MPRNSWRLHAGQKWEEKSEALESNERQLYEMGATAGEQVGDGTRLK